MIVSEFALFLQMSTIDKRRIAGNTLLLYIRMVLIMLINLYVVRVVVDALGNKDYGIYNTVAGIVMMLSFIANTLSVACQRYYSHEMVCSDSSGLRNVFNLSLLVFISVAVLLIPILELGGPWLMERKLQLDGRDVAAKWAFQCAVLSFVISVIRTPYQGMIIAREKMKVYAYISVFEALASLIIAILVDKSDGDRLILYAVLMCVVQVAVSLYYFLYCTIFYRECRLRFYWSMAKFKEMFSFVGWNMIGALSGTCKSYGITLLLNHFFGNIIVTARTLAFKAYMTIMQLSDNFYMAIRPQIFKSYSDGEKSGMLRLVCQSTKFSFFLVLIISLPMFLETESILNVWMREDVTPEAVLFTKLSIVNLLIEVFVNPLASSMQAYGNIRDYQLICGGLLLLILPVAYILLRMGFAAASVFWVSIVVCFIAVVVRVVLVNHYIGLDIKGYCRDVVLPILEVMITASVIPVFLELTINGTWSRFVAVCVTSVLMVALAVYVIGLTRTERLHLNETITGVLKRIK